MSDASTPAARARRRAACLDAMGVVRWVARSPQAAPVAEAEPPKLEQPSIEPPPRWEALQEQVAVCTRCQLHESRTQSVFGVGSRSAQLMLIGEAPGADEDRQGEPFVGRAGQLLNAMLRAAGFERDTVFIANILKCRPPRNRDPQPEEVDACRPYLEAQIALLQPRLILALGRISAQNLLRTDTPVGRLRGRLHRLEPSGIPLIVTYHPAYLLRNPRDKRRAWEDLKLVKKSLKHPLSIP
jgi:uracil-DNA glycosylase family 4